MYYYLSPHVTCHNGCTAVLRLPLVVEYFLQLILCCTCHCTRLITYTCADGDQSGLVLSMLWCPQKLCLLALYYSCISTVSYFSWEVVSTSILVVLHIQLVIVVVHGERTVCSVVMIVTNMSMADERRGSSWVVTVLLPAACRWYD